MIYSPSDDSYPRDCAICDKEFTTHTYTDNDKCPDCWEAHAKTFAGRFEALAFAWRDLKSELFKTYPFRLLAKFVTWIESKL